MAVLPVKKVTMVGLIQNRDDVLSMIQRSGMLEITDLTSEPGELPEGLERPDPARDETLAGYRLDMERLEEAIRFIGRYDESKTSLLDVPPAATPEEMARAARRDREPVMARVDEILSLRKQIADIRAGMLRVENRMRQIEPWRPLPIPVEDIRDTRDAVVTAGAIPAAEWCGFIDGIREMNTLALEEISSDRESIRLLALCHRLEGGTLARALSRAGFVRAEFTGEKGLPADILSGYARALDEYRAQIAGVGEKAAGLTGSLGSMKRLYDALMMLRDRRDAALRLGETRNVFYVSGWIPARDSDEFRRRVLDVTPAVEIELRDPRRGEFPPTFIENRKIVEPFEAVTEMYSTPRSTELDPNAVMAPFFFAFFGMMVSDAGYGLLLAAAGAAMYYVMRRRGSGAKLILVVTLGGVSTFLWGALFGGWFGFSLRPLWFNPLEDPLTMLIVCFALGLVQIMTGIVIKAVGEWRSGRVAQALFGHLCWVLLFAGLLALAAPSLGSSPALAAAGLAGKILSLTAVAGIVLGNAYISFAAKWRSMGRHTVLSALGAGIGGLMSGVMSLYGITGLFSDILSYSRLFALGLATGVVGMVINSIIAMLVSGSGIAAALGWIAAVLVFAGGHLFNTVINSLGAYVHASRLQYIEYFGKFFEGGGRPFRPFRLRTRYHLLKTGQ